MKTFLYLFFIGLGIYTVGDDPFVGLLIFTLIYVVGILHITALEKKQHSTDNYKNNDVSKYRKKFIENVKNNKKISYVVIEYNNKNKTFKKETRYANHKG